MANDADLHLLMFTFKSHWSAQPLILISCGTSLETAIKMPAGDTVRNAIFQQTEKLSTF